MVLLIAIIAICIIGSLLPQDLTSRQYIQRYGPVAYGFMAVLGLTVIFHSWYFFVILGLFGVSLIISLLKAPWRWSNAGIFLAHLGALVILLGGLSSTLYAKRGTLELRQGEIKDSYLKSDGREEALPFRVRLDSFSIEGFKSRLSIIEKDWIAVQKMLEVNHPLAFKGYTLYQSEYRAEDPEWTGLEVVRDPGVVIVYVGLALLNAGVLLAVLTGAKYVP